VLCHPALSQRELCRAAATSITHQLRAMLAPRRVGKSQPRLRFGSRLGQPGTAGRRGAGEGVRPSCCSGAVPAQQRRSTPCMGWGLVHPPLSAPLNKTSLLPKAFCSLGRSRDRSCLPLERDRVWKLGSAAEGAGKRTFF